MQTLHTHIPSTSCSGSRCWLLLTALQGPGGAAFGGHQTFSCLLKEPDAPHVKGARPSSLGSLGCRAGDQMVPVPAIASTSRRTRRHPGSERSLIGFESQVGVGNKKHH